MKNILVTGGAGFIGINTASFYIKKGSNVTIVDNFSRRGVEKNLKWLRKKENGKFNLIKLDISKGSQKLEKIVSEADIIFHFAGQVAVTSSVKNPIHDFTSNAYGTINLLEAVRKSAKNPILVYSSTNKVYGELLDLPIKEGRTRYDFKTIPEGISEIQPLDFHSPYGCSKGSADQYVRDYSRIYNMRTIVFRQSCIYGPHQYGFEDQGWVAWFMIACFLNKKITVYGNGKQVRDLLYIDDLIEAYDMAIKNISKTSGQIYNIGGGRKNSISIWLEFKPILEKMFEKKISERFEKTRPGDQKIFVSNNEKAKKDFLWYPKTDLKDGLSKLAIWIKENEGEFT